MIYKGLKIRLFPTKQQEELLIKSANFARFVYNWAIERQNSEYSLNHKYISKYDLKKEFVIIRKENLWMQEISCNIYKQAIFDCDNAFQLFFKKTRSYPVFKSKKKSKMSFYSDPGTMHLKSNSIYILKIGDIKIKDPRINSLIDKNIYNPRIVFNNIFWELNISYKEDLVIKSQKYSEGIGIDIGIKRFVVTSNNKIYKNINKTRKIKLLEKRINRQQKSLKRKVYNSNNYNKEIINIRKSYYRTKNIRNNYLYEIVNDLVRTKPEFIKAETLSIKDMSKKHNIAKEISKLNIYKFLELLNFKCIINGIEFMKIDKWFPSSKTCSCCGCIKSDLKLSDRTYFCPHCGLIIDRDLNAAINIKNYH